MIKREIIMAYALKNALEHDGVGIAGAVVNSLFNEGLEKKGIKEIMPLVLEVLNEINRWDNDVKVKEFAKLEGLIGHRVEREGLKDLEGVGKKGIVMRFAPSASGPMHIGHAMSSSLSYLYFKKYNGKFYVRIEDTNPENSFKESYKLLKDDAKWLFEGNAEIVIQSERMDLYYKYAEKLIKKEMAYVCECDGDEFRKLSLKKKACRCRGSGVKENIVKWKNMLDKKGYEQGKAVLRFKSCMDLNNPAMRDFPLARINEAKHPLQGLKYRVWPLMNLSVSVDDIEMKMTHIIRGKDHRDNAEKQKMIFEVLGKKYPHAYFLGIIHFKGLELSTTKMREMIDNKEYSGWDDKNLPTLLSLKKQGYKPNAFHKFAEQIGLNEVDKKMTKKEFFDLLFSFNKN